MDDDAAFDSIFEDPHPEVRKQEWLARKQVVYEDRVYKFIMVELGLAEELRIARQEAMAITGKPNLSAELFMRHCHVLPVWLAVRRIPFVQQSFTIKDFFNRFPATAVFQRYMEVQTDVSPEWDGYLGLAFTMPKVRGSRGVMVLHNAPGPICGAWMQSVVRGVTYTVERLTSLLGRSKPSSAE